MSNLKVQNYNENLKTNLKHRSYTFSILIIKFVSEFSNKRVYWIIADQLLRAATSIGANIIEAKSSSSRREFIKFYEIALKSANETIYWLNLLKDAHLLDSTDLLSLINEANEISNMLGSSLITLKGKRTY